MSQAFYTFRDLMSRIKLLLSSKPEAKPVFKSFSVSKILSQDDIQERSDHLSCLLSFDHTKQNVLTLILKFELPSSIESIKQWNNVI